MTGSSIRRSRGRAFLGLALIALASAVPVRAETPRLADAPRPLADIEALLYSDDRVFASPEIAVAPLEPEYEVIGQGEASYYGRELAGNRTASGERFNPNGLTAAHRTLPLGTKLRVVNLSNGKSVVVRVNDRGPYARGRILDLSLGAAQQIAMVGPGKANVRFELLR